ncbi:MAG: undecaprenyl-diphosphate phosphatase [Flavobacteriaceae bacterium]
MIRAAAMDAANCGMDMAAGSLGEAALLGLLEGLTEFIPVSSTGHLLLAGHFLGFESTGKAFEVLIQLGAVLAVITVYFTRLWHVLVTLPSSGRSRGFVIGILIAFLPAAVIGVLAHDFIKNILFETPALICITLIVGGLVLMWIDRRPLRVTHQDAMEFSPGLCLKIGLCQCLAMIPGVSRSGATIGGAMLLGVEKRAAAEFSFFLAMPTMAGAFAYDAWKNRDLLSADDAALIAVGFVFAFVAGVFVVRGLLDFVSRHGFAFFAWWRIIVGTAGLAGLYLLG